MRKILSEKVVLERIGKPHRSTLYRQVKAGKFPAPVQTSENRKGWYEDEIDEHIANLPIHQRMSDSDVDDACEALDSYLALWPEEREFTSQQFDLTSVVTP